MDKLKRNKIELNHFLNSLGTKYLPDHLRPHFSTTTHFMERLLEDRSDHLDKVWVSVTFSKLFRSRLCEFMYLLETTPDHGRINLQYQGKSIALVKNEGNITVITCFSGVALNPTKEYSILSLDEEQTETTDG